MTRSHRDSTAPGSRGLDLYEIRARLDADLTRLSQEAGDSAGADTILSGNGDDTADDGARRTRIDQDASVHDNTMRLLQQTAAALHRVDSGTYGMCECCGRAIDEARLVAFPQATTCLPCRRLAAGPGNAVHGRKR